MYVVLLEMYEGKDKVSGRWINMTKKNNINKDKDNKDDNTCLGYGVAFGLLAGAIFSSIVGVIFEFPLIWAFGPGFGVLIGIVVGSVMDSNKSENGW